MGDGINIRKTHPGFYWMMMTLAIFGIANGLNFIINSPTFPIYSAPNVLWGVIFIVIGIGKTIALNFYRRLRLVRALMACAVVYMMFLALGATQPFLEGTGSLQNPLLYAALSGVQIWFLLREPFWNPATDKNNK